ncbi:MAG TPA: CAP domain-containing protein [Thermoanaerobaculia bacterium]|jgi:hypothetical protein
MIKKLTILLVLALPVVAAGTVQEAERATLRQHVLKLINADRREYNLPPVALDPKLSKLGDEYCRRQIVAGTTGHFTIDGLAPYMRYSFAGGNDGLTENAAAWSAPYTFTDRALFEIARRSQDAMMGEVPPHDGHKRAILDPHATHVGIGLAWERGEFRLVHEFVRRYVDWSRPFPRAARIGDTITGGGRPHSGVRVEAVSVHHEPLPQPLTRQAANAINTYGLPETRKDYTPRSPRPELRIGGRRNPLFLAPDGAFTFDVPLLDGPGIYTVVVWVKKEGDTRAIAASNVSIRVDAAAFAGTR